MNILRINKDSLTEELSYRALLGDSITKLKLAGHNINLVNKDDLITDESDAYLDIQPSEYLQSSTSNPITLYNWLYEVDNELYNQDIIRIFIDSFSLTEALQTRIISDKLYNLLDSLILIIPSDNHLFDNVEPDIIIKSKSSDLLYTGNISIQLFITMKISQPDKNEYEIINSIEVYPPAKTGITSKQPEVNAVVLPWQAKVPYILSQNHQNISNLLKTKYTTVKTKFKFIDMKSYGDSWEYKYHNNNDPKPYEIRLNNKTEISNEKKSVQFIKSPDNIQWIQCFNDEWDVSDDTLVNKGYLYDTITGYQVIPDWSLAGKIGNSRSGKRFFLLHERPIDDQDYIRGINKDDIWVYYESSKETEAYSWKADNLDEALKEIENKINNPCHQSGMRVSSLYLLSTNYTINVKQQILKKHNMEAITDLT